MFRKIGLILLFIVILCALGWNIVQLQRMNEKILSMESKIDRVAKEAAAVPASAETGQRGYDLTIDMWQIFEKELQDYKQRLREGKQQFTEQQSSWNSLLVELKKSLQEYDKFIAAEGDFWEKQLKNYDKLLAKTEGRFEILGQVIEELRGVIADFQNWWSGQEVVIKRRETEAVPAQEKAEEPARRGQIITPQIKGRGEYKTYPPKEEEEEKPGEEEKGEVIRGTVTGSGEYRTY